MEGGWGCEGAKYGKWNLGYGRLMLTNSGGNMKGKGSIGRSRLEVEMKFGRQIRALEIAAP